MKGRRLLVVEGKEPNCLGVYCKDFTELGEIRHVTAMDILLKF